MDNLSTTKSDSLPKRDNAAMPAKKEFLGYDAQLGFWSQPKPFYAGILAGIVFQLAIMTVLLQMLSRV